MKPPDSPHRLQAAGGIVFDGVYTLGAVSINLLWLTSRSSHLDFTIDRNATRSNKPLKRLVRCGVVLG